jgi:tetratricopeptide (TPR) repeat protein
MVNNKFIQSEIDKALESFKKAKYHNAIKILENLEEKNSNFLICWYLGHSYFRIYDYSLAANYIKQSIKIKKPDELNQTFLGEILLGTNEYEDALVLFNNVLKINEKNINALFNLGKINFELGKFKLSEDYYNEIIKYEPNNFKALYELIKINKKYLTLDQIKNLKDHRDQNNLNNVYKSFILAEKHKNLKNYEDEINNLIKGHKEYLKIKEKAASQEFNYFTNLLPQFSKKVKDVEINLKCDNRPIFVMGLPRSGTTLVEQIINSSNLIHLAGQETGIMGKVFFSEQIILNYDEKNLKTNFNFNKKDFEILKNSILDQYKQIGINANKAFFTDKSLENLLYIDILNKVFPNAKFVYCKRNYLANLLGILKVFLPNLLWAHSIDTILKMFDLYEKKINEIIHEKKIPIKVIQLEELTSNPHNVSKDLFEFLELDWKDEYLISMPKKKQSIRTLSNIQVRNNISKHDLRYLDNYLPVLKKISNLI